MDHALEPTKKKVKQKILIDKLKKNFVKFLLFCFVAVKLSVSMKLALLVLLTSRKISSFDKQIQVKSKCRHANTGERKL